MKLTDKQKRFCEEYLIDCNATQAAIRAGYSEKTAAVIGAENLIKPNIQKYIDELMETVKKDSIAEATEVMEYLTSVMRREHKENVVVTLSEEVSTYVPDEKGTPRKQTVKKETPQIVQIPARLCDSNKAAELLAKRYGLLTDKVEVDVSKVEIIDDIPKDDVNE
ncbi:MAG: terminase small subunit [Clostridia bacterium]|nr:terminase small subunit [Clostridia bacterium]